MAKTHHFQELPGTRELYTLLNIINNKEKYQSILEELEGKRLEVNQSIENMGLAGNIESMHSQAKADRLQAAHDLNEAKEVSSKIMSEADEQINKDAALIAEQQSILKAKEKAFEESKVATENLLDQKAESLKTQEQDLNVWCAKLQQRQEESKKTESAIEEKRKILTESLARMQ